MPESTECPKCKSSYGYPTGTSMMCPECGHEWSAEESTEAAANSEVIDESLIKDANGNVLQDGDTVVLIKDLPVKGASKAIRPAPKSKT